MSNWKSLFARWGSGAGEIDEVRMDASTNSLQTISYEHHEIHSGSHFTYSVIDADFDIIDALDILIITPNDGKWAHMVFDVQAALDTNVQIWENTAAAGHTSAGALLVYNNNRNSITANTTTINTSNDDAADGTMIFESQFGIDTGNGSNRVVGGGGVRGSEEWVLKQNSKYIFRITSGSDASVLSVKLSWYEHEDRH